MNLTEASIKSASRHPEIKVIYLLAQARGHGLDKRHGQLREYNGKHGSESHAEEESKYHLHDNHNYHHLCLMRSSRCLLPTPQHMALPPLQTSAADTHL